jgi:hypothetical protein
MSHYKKYHIKQTPPLKGVSKDDEINHLKFGRGCVQVFRVPEPCPECPEPEIPDPCLLPLFIHNVMGQEDIYRKTIHLINDEETGEQLEIYARQKNYGYARAVVSTTVPTKVNILYSPGTEDLNLETGFTATESMFHEIYFQVFAPDALYALKVIAKRESCGNEIAESGIYYFVTSPYVQLQSGNLVAEPEITFTFIAKEINKTVEAIGFATEETNGQIDGPTMTISTEIASVGKTIDRILSDSELRINIEFEEK